MSETTKKWITEVAMPAIKANPKNRNKGLIPRFHKDLSDQFYGGTNQSLAKVCGELAKEGFFHKAFVKFAPDDTDQVNETADDHGNKVVVDGPHKGMKVGKDGKLSTPIYWLRGDPDIPSWANDRGTNFKSGKDWFEKNKEEAVG